MVNKYEKEALEDYEKCVGELSEPERNIFFYGFNYGVNAVVKATKDLDNNNFD